MLVTYYDHVHSYGCDLPSHPRYVLGCSRCMRQFVKMISELYHFKLSASFHLAVGDDVIPVSLVDLVNCVNHTVLYFAWNTYLQDLGKFCVFYILQSNLMLCGSGLNSLKRWMFVTIWLVHSSYQINIPLSKLTTHRSNMESPKSSPLRACIQRIGSGIKKLRVPGSIWFSQDACPLLETVCSANEGSSVVGLENVATGTLQSQNIPSTLSLWSQREIVEQSPASKSEPDLASVQAGLPRSGAIDAGLNILKLAAQLLDSALDGSFVPGLKGAVSAVLKITDQFEVSFTLLVNLDSQF